MHVLTHGDGSSFTTVTLARVVSRFCECPGISALPARPPARSRNRACHSRTYFIRWVSGWRWRPIPAASWRRRRRAWGLYARRFDGRRWTPGRGPAGGGACARATVSGAAADASRSWPTGTTSALFDGPARFGFCVVSAADGGRPRLVPVALSGSDGVHAAGAALRGSHTCGLRGARTEPGFCCAGLRGPARARWPLPARGPGGPTCPTTPAWLLPGAADRDGDRPAAPGAISRGRAAVVSRSWQGYAVKLVRTGKLAIEVPLSDFTGNPNGPALPHRAAGAFLDRRAGSARARPAGDRRTAVDRCSPTCPRTVPR